MCSFNMTVHWDSRTGGWGTSPVSLCFCFSVYLCLMGYESGFLPAGSSSHSRYMSTSHISENVYWNDSIHLNKSGCFFFFAGRSVPFVDGMTLNTAGALQRTVWALGCGWYVFLFKLWPMNKWPQLRHTLHMTFIWLDYELRIWAGGVCGLFGQGVCLCEHMCSASLCAFPSCIVLTCVSICKCDYKGVFHWLCTSTSIYSSREYDSACENICKVSYVALGVLKK